MAKKKFVERRRKEAQVGIRDRIDARSKVHEFVTAISDMGRDTTA